MSDNTTYQIYEELSIKDKQRIKNEFLTTLECDIDTIVPSEDYKKKKSSKQFRKISGNARWMTNILLRGFHNTETNACFPAIKTVAAIMGCDTRQVKSYMAEMVAAGYLYRKQRPMEKTEYQVCDTWFNWDKINERKERTNDIYRRKIVRGTKVIVVSAFMLGVREFAATEGGIPQPPSEGICSDRVRDSARDSAESLTLTLEDNLGNVTLEERTLEYGSSAAPMPLPSSSLCQEKSNSTLSGYSPATGLSDIKKEQARADGLTDMEKEQRARELARSYVRTHMPGKQKPPPRLPTR
jgi:hypothetical protein